VDVGIFGLDMTGDAHFCYCHLYDCDTVLIRLYCYKKDYKKGDNFMFFFQRFLIKIMKNFDEWNKSRDKNHV